MRKHEIKFRPLIDYNWLPLNCISHILFFISFSQKKLFKSSLKWRFLIYLSFCSIFDQHDQHSIFITLSSVSFWSLLSWTISCSTLVCIHCIFFLSLRIKAKINESKTENTFSLAAICFTHRACLASSWCWFAHAEHVIRFRSTLCRLSNSSNVRHRVTWSDHFGSINWPSSSSLIQSSSPCRSIPLRLSFASASSSSSSSSSSSPASSAASSPASVFVPLPSYSDRRRFSFQINSLSGAGASAEIQYPFAVCSNISRAVSAELQVHFQPPTFSVLSIFRKLSFAALLLQSYLCLLAVDFVLLSCTFLQQTLFCLQLHNLFDFRLSLSFTFFLSRLMQSDTFCQSDFPSFVLFTLESTVNTLARSFVVRSNHSFSLVEINLSSNCQLSELFVFLHLHSPSSSSYGSALKSWKSTPVRFRHRLLSVQTQIRQSIRIENRYPRFFWSIILHAPIDAPTLFATIRPIDFSRSRTNLDSQLRTLVNYLVSRSSHRLFTRFNWNGRLLRATDFLALSSYFRFS